MIDFNKAIPYLEPTEDELVPMEQWDGECWKTMFDALAEIAPDRDPWDLLAAFIKITLMDGENNGEENTERTDS